jgi:hypothetical protein
MVSHNQNEIISKVQFVSLVRSVKTSSIQSSFTTQSLILTCQASRPRPSVRSAGATALLCRTNLSIQTRGNLLEEEQRNEYSNEKEEGVGKEIGDMKDESKTG